MDTICVSFYSVGHHFLMVNTIDILELICLFMYYELIRLFC